MIKFLKKFKNQKGIGIAITLMSLLLISMLGMALIIRSTSLASVVSNKNYSITAVESAKAGISCGIYEVGNNIFWGMSDPNSPNNVSITTMFNNKPITGYNVTDPWEKGYYTVKVVNNLEPDPNNPSSIYTDPETGYRVPPGTIEIVSTGYAGNPNSPEGAARNVRIVAIGNKVVLNTNPFSRAAIAAGDPNDPTATVITATGNAKVTDSYNSNVNPIYDSDTAGNNGDVAANGGIDLGNREAYGDVTATGSYSGPDPLGPDPNGFQQLSTPLILPPVPNIPSGLPARTFP